MATSQAIWITGLAEGTSDILSGIKAQECSLRPHAVVYLSSALGAP